MKTSTTISPLARMRTKAYGFTIVEMLLVVTIIALLAGLAGAMYVGTYKRMQVEKGARGIFSAARYARIIAIEKRKNCKLILDKTNNRFYLAIDSPNRNDDEKGGQIIKNQYTKPTQFSDKVSFESIMITSTAEVDMQGREFEDVVVFKPNGTADTAVMQIGDGKNHYTVYILAGTGKARIKQGKATESPVEIIDLDEL